MNSRAVGGKEGRTIAGDSMGGFGAIHYAELYSNNFIYSTSFSEVLNILDSRLQNIILSLLKPESPCINPFGFPSAPVGSNGWLEKDALTRAAGLLDIAIALYKDSVGSLESVILDGSSHLRDLLVMLNIPVYFGDYGSRQSIGYGCEGTHVWLSYNNSIEEISNIDELNIKTKRLEVFS